MQPPTFREIAARLTKEGWEPAHQRGSHVKYRKGSQMVTINGTGGDRPKAGTWANIRRQAGW